MRLGRPPGPGKPKLDAFRPEIEALLGHGSTRRFIARRYITTEANLHNWLKKNGLKAEAIRNESQVYESLMPFVGFYPILPAMLNFIRNTQEAASLAFNKVF